MFKFLLVNLSLFSCSCWFLKKNALKMTETLFWNPRVGKNLSGLWSAPLRILEDVDGGGGSKDPRGRVDGGRRERKQAGQTGGDWKRRGGGRDLGAGLTHGPWGLCPKLRKPAAFLYTELRKLVLWYSPLEEELLLLPFYRWRKRLRKVSRIFRRAKIAALVCTRPSV